MCIRVRADGKFQRVACFSGHLDAVKWLVANNADITVVSMTGQTAQDRASTYQHTDVASYLQTCARDLHNPASQYAMTRTVTSSSVRYDISISCIELIAQLAEHRCDDVLGAIA